MKKLFYIFLIFFIYLFFAQNVSAFEFVKSTENPLTINYINDYASHLQANIFKEEDLYKGVFVIKRPSETYYSLGYFESVNGVDWQMKKEILNTGEDLSNPSAIKTQTGYQLFITRFDNNSAYGIYSVSCDFEFNCLPNLSTVIIPDSNNHSESNGLFAGHPFIQDKRTFLFFGTWGYNGFKIKLAYSDDLITWQRCPDNNAFLYDGDGPFPYIDGNDLYLFFHRSDSRGIKLAKSILPLTCDSVFEDQGYLLTRDKSYDQKHLIFPSVLNENGSLKLFYSGLGSDNQWHLNLACSGPCLPLALTSTPTKILTPTGPENPTPTMKIPIIILPGTFASWNREAILHNKEVPYTDWKLQSFVKEYNGLINTLINLGYEINNNLYVFPFDWRQEIEKTANDLESFLKQKVWFADPDKKINIIGHSLGGLVGRIFTQKNKDKVNWVITVGTPHQGVVQVYKPLESGEIDRDNTFFWLAAKTILILNKSTIESDRTTLVNKFPVAKDLFPTFNFLKDLAGNEIDINNLSIKNSSLPKYNQNFFDIFPIFTAIYGEGGKNTPAGFIVEPQNNLDKLLGNYSDGKPKEPYFDLGDYTILTKSAKEDADAEKLNLDHGGLIYQRDGIKKILDLLHIQFEDLQIAEGKGTKIDSSIIFFIKSPATMEVVFNGQTYPEQEGIIFIENAQSGDYQLKVKGIDQGKYEVVVGQISKNNDIWENIKGETNVSQIDEYEVNYNSETAHTIFPSPTICAGQACLTPTMTHTPMPTPTEQIYLFPTRALISTPVPQSTNSPSEILGISSQQEKLIITPIEIINQKKIKEETKKFSIINFVLPSLIISSLLTAANWLVRKNLRKNRPLNLFKNDVS